jgi:hypothetical protein
LDLARSRQRCETDQSADGFGFGSLGLDPADLTVPGVVVQLGHAPKRIDLLTSIDGAGFDDCWADHVVLDIGGLAVPFIDVDHLVANKRASGRLQDWPMWRRSSETVRIRASRAGCGKGRGTSVCLTRPTVGLPPQT